MEDFIYILVMVAFVIIAALFVVGCDRIIGPDEAALVDHGRDVDDSHDTVGVGVGDETGGRA